MPLEAIQQIRAAETNADRIKTEAAAKAKQMVVSAEQTGKSLVEAALRKADAELQTLARKIDEAAVIAERESLTNTAVQGAAIRAFAETRMDEAAQLILERIVSG